MAGESNNMMFDFDELEAEFDKMEQEHRAPRANPMMLKLIGMKIRHRAAGLVFKRSKDGRASGVESGELSRTLIDNKSPDLPLAAEGDASVSSVAKSNVQQVDGPSNIQGLKTIFLDPLCILLIFVPMGIVAHLSGASASWRFWLNFMALVPLAKVLGDATEELAASLGNDTVSGLLNASFGNAVEMIISVQTLRAGLLDVVKATLLGSILSNILLVLGSSLFLGGLTAPMNRHGRCYSVEDINFELKREASAAPACSSERRRMTLDLTIEKEQKFPVKNAQVCLGMLLVACMSVALPTVFDSFSTDDSVNVLKHRCHASATPSRAKSRCQVSRIGACIVGSSYIAFLVFQLLTHAQTLRKDENLGSNSTDDFNNEDDGSSGLTTTCSILLMFFTTLVVAISSEFLTGAISEVVARSHIPETFIGIILLPIAGNACEHAGAIRFAMQDRPGLAIGISVGSSTQIALLVIPFAVITGWLLGQPMDLNFGTMNATVMIMSILVVFVLVIDGRSNWMKGYMMMATYALLCVLYWYLPSSMGSPN